MKSLMLGACLAAMLGAPSFAQPDGQGGAQDQPDPYYDQAQPPQAPQPPPPPGPGGYEQEGPDRADSGYGQYQPPPPPPAGQPGFQVYRDNQGGQGDETYQGSRAYQGYQGDPAYEGYQPYGAYGPNGGAYGQNGGYGNGRAGAHYTGRVGSAWRNDEGQYCIWREMTWLDQRGQPAYRWVPRCR